MKYLLAVLAFLTISCSPNRLKNPFMKDPYGMPEDRLTLVAARIVDEVFVERGLTPVSGHIYVTWKDGDTFRGIRGKAAKGQDFPDGQFYGQELLRGNKTCYIWLAVRDGTISRSSLAHEMLHCSYQLSGFDPDGDREHKLFDWWLTIPEANQRLRKAGL